jgi:hypothetical protein
MNTKSRAPLPRLLAVLLLLCSAAASAAPKERWVYAPANYQVNEQADRIIALMKRAKAAGYTHFLITDSKFSRVPTLPQHYFANVARVRDAAEETGITLVPALFGVGYSNDLLSNDPNLAEGLPLKDALFVVKDSLAHHVPDPAVALEDLGASFLADHMKMDNPHFATYAFLSDFEVPRDVAQANFSFEWNRFNEFRATFSKGTVYPRLGFDPPQKAWVQAVPFSCFQKHRWYQLAVTWDDGAKSAELYVNDILIGTSDRFNKDFFRDKVGPTLYAGCPALCHGEVALYEQVLSRPELYKLYRERASKK